ncbi:hypothetical protein LSH36_374g04007 [Paralvinella palmiformis]|uniref:Uncharacterized protein n=1 Tax=Paralvinella palmiformis TaxID=53620 RepID=A0AAD9JDH2_9ANNE|nr:hypothetical protein LSH36_374g04007 [Paralvinella palmiformis]
MLSYKIFITFLIIFLAYVYKKYQINEDDISSTDPSKVINAWHKIIKDPEHKFTKVAVGINACVDLIADAVSVLKVMSVEPGGQQDHDILSSLEDLQESFHHHFAAGAAAERYFSERDVFNAIVQHAADLYGAQFSIGGNAALMTQKMAQSFPDLKYGVGARWGDTVAPVATRFITSHDVANSKASSLEYFFKAVSDYQPDLVVLSGLHMLEGQPANLWQERLKLTRDRLTLIDQQTPVHLELASMINEELMRMIASQASDDDVGFCFPFICDFC